MEFSFTYSKAFFLIYHYLLFFYFYPKFLLGSTKAEAAEKRNECKMQICKFHDKFLESLNNNYCQAFHFCGFFFLTLNDYK